MLRIELRGQCLEMALVVGAIHPYDPWTLPGGFFRAARQAISDSLCLEFRHDLSLGKPSYIRGIE